MVLTGETGHKLTVRGEQLEHRSGGLTELSVQHCGEAQESQAGWAGHRAKKIQESEDTEKEWFRGTRCVSWGPQHVSRCV